MVAELTGRMDEWWAVSVTLRQWSGWTAALQAAHDLYVTNDPGVVDRPGFAPGSPACKAGDLLNDRAAHWKMVAEAGFEPAMRGV